MKQTLIIVVVTIAVIASSWGCHLFWQKLRCDEAVSALATIQLCEMNAKCTFDIEAAKTFMESIKTRDECQT